MNHNYLRQSILALSIITFSLFVTSISTGQVKYTAPVKPAAAVSNTQVVKPAKAPTVVSYNPVVQPAGPHMDGEDIEDMYVKYLGLNVLQRAADSAGASSDEKISFEKYYHDKIFAEDRSAFLEAVHRGIITSDAGIKSFADEKVHEYVGLYQQFKGFEKDYPSSVKEYSSAPVAPAIACQSACSNIDFENGTLSSWYAYYCSNTSSTSANSNSALQGGAAGAVTRAGGPDPNSGNDYQVAIMSGAGVDPIAGALIPVVCPTGGNYSVRIGDSTRNGGEIGVLLQKFNVTNANENFVFMYAVVLENPSHNVFQQPYFHVETLDRNGNPIPGCGEYNVVSGPGLPGYHSFYYAPDHDTVYCLPWTTVYLPLKAYLGTCVTIKITAADCALGGHFGYAYFDAQCSPGVISSSPVICGNNVTLTAPAGAAAYKWMGPCIVGSNTNQTCTVSCAGTYSVVLTSSAGPSCTDTLTMSVAASTSPAPTISSVTEVACNGAATGSASVTVSGGTAPYTYAWTPSGGTGATASNLTAGTYTCTVHDVNGCTGSVSVTLTQPPALTATMGVPTEVKCNGASTGSITVTAGGGVSPYTYTWVPSGGTNATASNLAAGSYTVTVKDSHGCTATASITITQPTLLTATISSSINVSCNGGSNGSATVTAGGGTAAYTYAWAPSGGTNATASNLTAATYTVTVKDANGCTATTSVIINQPATLTATITGTSEVACNGGNDGSATVTAGGGTAAYTYTWTPSGGTSAVANNLTAGTYTITVKDAHGCTATSSVTLTQPTALTASITSSTNIDCNGNNDGVATVTAGGGTAPYTYNWNPGSGSSATVSNLPPATYTVTVTDAHACSATATVTITQPAVLTANITASTNVSCHGGNNGSATVTAGGGTAPYTYAWTPSGGSGTTASNLTAGTYTITVKDAHGCTTSASISITQPATLTANITSSNNVSCNGATSGSATVTAAGGTAPYTYAWTPSGGTNATASNLTAGSYTITVTDNHGCTATASITLTQPTALTDPVTSSTNVSCHGGNDGSATVTASGGVPAYNYNWTPSGGTNATASNLTAGTYTCTVTDNNGCTATASIIITQPITLIANITATTHDKCNGGATGSSTVTAGGGTAPYTYAWTPSGGSSTTASNLTAGTYTITVTDNHGCTATASVTITQPTLITTVTSFTAATCGSNNGSAAVVASNGTPGYTYNWAPSGGTNATASNLTAGSYTVTVKDANGCSVTAAVSVPNASGPTASIVSSVNELCNGGSNGSATASASGGLAPYTYSWAPSGGTNTTASNLTAGTYTIDVTDANGCLGTASVTITQPLAITIVINPIVEVKCNGGSTGKATAVPSGGTGAYTYAWTPSGGTNALASNLSAGTYTITVHDANGCSGTSSVTITEPPALTAAMAHTNDKCNGNSNGSATVTAGGGTPAYTYAWAPSGGTNNVASNLSAGTYTVTVTDANGCTITAKATVTQPVILTASVGSIVDILCNGGTNGSATANGAGGTAPYTYTWAPAGGTNQTATGLSAGTYTVTIKDKNGCTATASGVITQPAVLTANITATTNVDCNGNNDGSATVTAGGGTVAYTYAWAPSGGTNATASNLGPGTYTVTVTDANACTATASVVITQPAALTSNITTEIDEKCNGGNNGSATVTAAGGTVAYTYLWSPSGGSNATASNLTAGNYTVTVTDSHGCTSTSSVSIGQPSALTNSISSITNVSCNGSNNGNAFAQPSGGTSPYTYAWAPGGQTNAGATGLSAGTYTVTVTDNNGCSVTSSATITQPAALNTNITALTNVSCNGASDGKITVLASGGTVAYTYAWAPGGQTSATATGLAPGTYTVTVTDAHGCTSTASATITQPTVLSANITFSRNIDCNGNSSGAATVTAGGGSIPYTYAWAPSGGTGANANNLTAGIYTVTVTDGHGCTATATINLTQPAVLTANMTTIVDVNCNGDSSGMAIVTVGGGTTAYSYMWTNGSVTDTAANLTAGSYTVNVTDNNGCTASASVTITQPTLKVVSITGVTNVSCNGGTNGSATANVSGGTPPYSYSWSSGGGTNATAVNLTAGTYTVTVSGTHGCPVLDSVTITQPAPLSETTSTTNSTCGNSNGTARVNVSGGTAGYTYLWNPSGNTNATATGLPAGTYSVTITDSHGCLDSATATIVDLGAGIAKITSTQNVSCNGGSNGMAVVGMVGGTAPFAYNWSNGSTTNTASGLTIGVYTVTVTDAHGCNSTITDTITQPTPLSLDPAVTIATCGTSNGAISLSVSGGTPAYQYNWSTGATTTSINGLSAASYSVVVTDNNGCMDSVSVLVQNSNGANPSISSSSNVSCNGGSDGSAMVAIVGGTPPFKYSWSPSGGSNTVATGLSAGDYTVTVVDSNNCFSIATVLITQPTAIQDTILALTNNVCNGDNKGSATLSTFGGTPPYTYLWNNGSTQASSTGLTAGTYTISITDANGCLSTDSVTIVQPPPLIPVINGQDSICAGGTTILSSGVASSYLWSTGATTDSITVTPATTTTYTVYQTNGGCSDSVELTVVVSPPLIANMKHLDSICFGNSIQIAMNVTSGVPAYTYTWNNGLPNAPGPFTVTPPGPGTYICTVTDACGNTFTDSTMVKGAPGPHAGFTPSPDTVPGGQLISFVNTSIGGTNWYWNFGDGTTSVDSFPFHQYEAAGDYLVYLITTSAAGCKDSIAEEIVVTAPFVVPNVFTPNGDGINDVFHVTAGSMKTYTISIFNRWGQLIFTANDPSIDWTGRSNAGVAESDGAYFYEINATSYSGQVYKLKGYVQLIR